MTKIIQENIKALFQKFYTNPGDYDAFYAWRREIEDLLRTPHQEVLRRDNDFALLLPFVYQQMSIIPDRFNTETVSLKMRFNLLLQKLEEESTELLTTVRQQLYKETGENTRSVYELDHLTVQKVPQVVLKSRRSQGRKGQPDFITDQDLTYKTRLNRCQSPEHYDALVEALLVELYRSLQQNKPEATEAFLLNSHDIYVNLCKKTSNNDLIVGFIDILPYLLFRAHKAPYNQEYVNCARILKIEIFKLIRHEHVNFNKPDIGPIDDAFHYMFHALLYFLEHGRLVAFEDLLETLLVVLTHARKFQLKFYYLPLIAEIYYWIPQTYRTKISPRILAAIEGKAKEKPGGPLDQLFRMVNTSEIGNFDRTVIITEALKEVYKDREVQENEKIQIKNLVEKLGVSISQYRLLLRDVFREIRQDKILEEGDLNPIELLTRLVHMAMIDSQLPLQRKDWLLLTAEVFNISIAKFHEIVTGISTGKISSPGSKGLRRLGFTGVSRELLKALEWYKFKQLRLEHYQNIFADFLSTLDYEPSKNHIRLDGEVKEAFKPLSGEIKLVRFEEVEGREEIGVIVCTPRTSLRKWFEILNEIEYMIFETSSETLSIELFLLNHKGQLQITRDLPVKEPQKLYEILETNHGRCRVLIVESGRMELVHWLRHPAYLIDRKKIEPLLDTMLSKNKSFTSIKIISQIGQRRNPDEIIYTHAMVENVLFLGGEIGEYQKMAELCKQLVDSKFKNDFKLFYYLGYLHFEMGNKEEGFLWTSRCLQAKPDFRNALYLYVEHKLAEDILDPRGLGYLKYLDLYFPEDEKLQDIYDGLEKKHQIDLSQLLSHSRLTIVSTGSKLKDQHGSTS